MAKSTYHVIARSDGSWSVVRTGAERASGNYSTKKEAVSTAKRLVTSSGGELIVHTRDGRVSKRDTFGHVPASANGKGRAGTGTRIVRG